MARPDVSVIIPAFNYARFLDQTLDSVANQTLGSWECIVVDDGSTDDTAEVVRRHVDCDGRFRYQRQENRGLAATRNRGLAAASGRYIQFLDADDLIARDKLAAQVAILDGEAIDVSYSNFYTFDSATGATIARYEGRLVGERPLEDFLFYWERGLTIPIHAGLFRRELWDGAEAFDEGLRAKEDWVMWVGLALGGARFAHLDRDLALYRQHDSNMCRIRGDMTIQFARAALKIITMIPDDLVRRFVEATTAYLGSSLDEIAKGRGGDGQRMEQENELMATSERKLGLREGALDEQEEAVVAAQHELARREEEIRRCTRELSASRERVEKSRRDLERREQELLAARHDVVRRSRHLRVREKALAVKLSDVSTREGELRASEGEIVERQAAVERIEARLESWERELASLADTLDEGRKFVVASAAAMEAERRSLAESGAEIRARGLATMQSEEELDARRRQFEAEQARLAVDRAELGAEQARRLAALDAENAELRTSLARVESSKFWRLGQFYWRLRYHLGFGRS